MIDNAVSKLAAYALQTGLIEENESIWAVNTILDVLKLDSYTDPQENWGEIELAPVLEELLEDAHALSCWKKIPWSIGTCLTRS